MQWIKLQHRRINRQGAVLESETYLMYDPETNSRSLTSTISYPTEQSFYLMQDDSAKPLVQQALQRGDQLLVIHDDLPRDYSEFKVQYPEYFI